MLFDLCAYLENSSQNHWFVLDPKEEEHISILQLSLLYIYLSDVNYT